jgi:hypothetical protein
VCLFVFGGLGERERVKFYPHIHDAGGKRKSLQAKSVVTKRINKEFIDAQYLVEGGQ